LDPIKRPTKPGQWEIFARSEKIGKAWEELCNHWPARCQEIFDILSSAPDYDDGDRQGRLRGKLSEGSFEGQNYVRWQIDVNGASRVWYFVDSTAYGVKQKKRGGRVIIDQIHFGHPKQTE
jgi:hypothetical protein